MPVLGFANGCFDGMHDGQKHFLRECVLNCDRLVVAVNSDISVVALKGKPGNNLVTRCMAVEAVVRPGDRIVDFNTEQELEDLIRKTSPLVLFKGEDYAGKSVTGSRFVRRIHYVARHPGYVSTGQNWPLKA